MEQKRFLKKDESFVCAFCGKEVPALGYTSRDHCPHCLCSCHVDEFPGDRANPCRGKLTPVQSLPDARRGFILVFRCEKCKKTVRCKAAEDDDMEALIALSVHP